MRLSPLLSIGSAVAGGMAAWRVLSRRQAWERQNRRVAICVDFDDLQAAAIRAGLPFDEMLSRLAEAGATHVSLPEWTLDRLQRAGQLSPQAPREPLRRPAPVGHWNYLHGEAELVAPLAVELRRRLAHTDPAVLDEGTLAFAGDLPTIGQIGLGFDLAAAETIRDHRLGVVPRPVSYDWPQKKLLERTLAQAAQVGRVVAFAGDMILGHEMHLDETVVALAANDLTFVYFAESRHQKGDWFIAKRRLPRVVLGHRFTPAEMIPLDYHAACHNWVHFARERGIRFCYVNFFRALHATEPLEGLAYVHHLKHALEAAGFVVSPQIDLPVPVPGPSSADLALTGLTAAGISAGAATQLFDLPETAALPLLAVTSAGAVALPFLEEARNRAAAGRQAHSHEGHQHEHEHADLAAVYPPSYAPKLLALGLAALTPLVLQGHPGERAAGDWLSRQLYQMAAAAALAAVTSGQEYQLRVETYRGFNLEWLLPLAGWAWRLPDARFRFPMLASLAVGWLLARQRDVDLLGQLDPGHAEGHTHHISAAMALLGDVQMAIGPRPARKWVGLGPLAAAISDNLATNGREQAASFASALNITGVALGLTGFRHPERSLDETLPLAAPSYAIGLGLGLLARLAAQIKAAG